MYKVILVIGWVMFISVNLLNAQSIVWTGNAENNDFFDESNWKDQSSNLPPADGTIDSDLNINMQLEITGAETDINASGTIKLGSGRLSVEGTNLKASAIDGGKIVLHKDAYIELNGASPLLGEPLIEFLSPIAWLKLLLVVPGDVLSDYTDLFTVDSKPAQYPENIRYDNYYNKGVVIRREDAAAKSLAIYSESSFTGNFEWLEINKIHSGNVIPGELDNATSSFILKKGYMVTFANNEDGTGLSKVYIASEDDLEIANLPTPLNNHISFIRVVHWNWVSKKGIGGNITGLDETWHYNWGNNGNSTIERENVPMSWGKGGADEDSDIEKYKSKYKATHVLAFNESDNCNDQSGQWGNLCQTDVAVATYENLMKTGLRLVSPSCRENAPFGWLKEFYDKATEQDIRIDVIGVHWYDWGGSPKNTPDANPQNVFNRFKNYLQRVYDIYQLPIWITEFNANINRTTYVNSEFMKLALPYLESLDYVERYAWFQPNSGVADYFDSQENYTSVGEFYKAFASTPAITDSILDAPNNLDEKIISNVSDFSFPNNKEKIFVYPIPTNEVLNIVSYMECKEIRIFNIQGVLVLRTLYRPAINVSNLLPGVYIVKADQHVFKIVKN